MHAVVETSIFARRADTLLSQDERMALITKLASDPLAGDLIPGLGGIRKLRFAAAGRGKSGGVRVIYYLPGDDWPILALLIYGKGEQANPTPDQRKTMLAVIERMKRDARQ